MYTRNKETYLHTYFRNRHKTTRQTGMLLIIAERNVN